MIHPQMSDHSHNRVETIHVPATGGSAVDHALQSSRLHHNPSAGAAASLPTMKIGIPGFHSVSDYPPSPAATAMSHHLPPIQHQGGINKLVTGDSPTNLRPLPSNKLGLIPNDGGLILDNDLLPRSGSPQTLVELQAATNMMAQASIAASVAVSNNDAQNNNINNDDGSGNDDNDGKGNNVNTTTTRAASDLNVNANPQSTPPLQPFTSPGHVTTFLCYQQSAPDPLIGSDNMMM
jgi:hypothetical protein